MAEGDWFVAVAGGDLMQGDVLTDFPAPVVRSVEFEDGRPRLEAEIEIVDVAIMTQSCDLEHDKTERVLLCRVAAWEDLVREELSRGNQLVVSSQFIDKLIAGALPPLSLLHRRGAPPRLPWSVVDFREHYLATPAHIRSHLEARGHPRRLRMRSPYREHLAQAFARYHMSVGLPHDAAAFRAEGKAIASAVQENLPGR